MKKVFFLSDEEFKIMISHVKRDILYQIILNMKQYEISKEEAQRLAVDFLAVMPIKDAQDLIKKLRILGKSYKEIRTVFIKYANEYYIKEKQYILNVVPLYIQKGEINETLEIVKGGNYHE